MGLNVGLKRAWPNKFWRPAGLKINGPGWAGPWILGRCKGLRWRQVLCRSSAGTLNKQLQYERFKGRRHGYRQTRCCWQRWRLLRTEICWAVSEFVAHCSASTITKSTGDCQWYFTFKIHFDFNFCKFFCQSFLFLYYISIDLNSYFSFYKFLYQSFLFIIYQYCRKQSFQFYVVSTKLF